VSELKLCSATPNSFDISIGIHCRHFQSRNIIPLKNYERLTQCCFSGSRILALKTTLKISHTNLQWKKKKKKKNRHKPDWLHPWSRSLSSPLGMRWPAVFATGFYTIFDNDVFLLLLWCCEPRGAEISREIWPPPGPHTAGQHSVSCYLFLYLWLEI
jgi:hypothetical protein